jgi:hypothetical protein
VYSTVYVSTLTGNANMVLSSIQGTGVYLGIHINPNNMPLLQEMLHIHIRLVDYECITANATANLNDPKSRPRSLVTFGIFAGIADMMDMCQGLGHHLLAHGYLKRKINCIGARHAHQGCQAESFDSGA